MCVGITSIRYAAPAAASNDTSTPFQRLIFSGSVRNSHTVSGLASITSSRVSATRSVVLSTPSPLLALSFTLERIQFLVPEALQERLHLIETLRSHAVQTACPVSAFVHEPGLLEHGEMLRDRRTRHLEMGVDLAGRQLGRPDERQDPPAVRLGDRFVAVAFVECPGFITLVPTEVCFVRLAVGIQVLAVAAAASRSSRRPSTPPRAERSCRSPQVPNCSRRPQALKLNQPSIGSSASWPEAHVPHVRAQPYNIVEQQQKPCAGASSVSGRR